MKAKTKKFLSYYKPYKSYIIKDLLCAFIQASGSIAIPYVISHITRDLITNEGIASQNFKTILWFILLLVGLLVVEYLTQLYVTYVGHYAGTLMEADLREELFGHYQKLSFTFYDENKTGALMSRLTNDLFSLTELYHHGPEDIVLSFIKIVGSFILLMFVNWRLTLIVYAFIPLLLLFILYYNRKMNYIFKKNKKYISNINEQVEDNLSGIRVVKSFTNETEEKRKFSLGNNDFVKSKKERYRLMGNYHAILSVFSSGLQVVVIFVGSLLIYYGTNNANALDTADFLLFLMLIGNLTSAVRQFIAFFEVFQEGYTGFERFYELMQVEEEVYEKENPIVLDKIEGKIDINDVSFRYKNQKHDVLSHLDLHIEKGEYVALVGESGVGKSTICSLIPRFYDVMSGSIKIDGYDVKDLSLKTLRENIGIVFQDVYLFNGNVLDNIRYGDLNASEEMVMEACKKANADIFINQLENGLYTDIGQRGVRLSGGQKQRLSIARVFLKNPPILIFDEATSSLDNESELVIKEALEELAKGRTTIVIAHRLSTIKNAKRIVLISKEGIVETGTHEELLARKGAYYKLYNAYF